MGLIKKKGKSSGTSVGEITITEGFLATNVNSTPADASAPPKLARRSLNRESHIRSGRTIAEKREKLETSSERTSAHRKIRQKQQMRILVTVLGFAAAAIVIIGISVLFIGKNHDEEEAIATVTPSTITYSPTIEITDEDAGPTGITTRMREYIGQAEADFRELGLTPVRAVIPSGAIREVDFYLDGYPGYIKTVIDRGTGISVEDTERMLRYLAGQDITEWEYIDVRIDGKAYWK